jgi:hypothetical protein
MRRIVLVGLGVWAASGIVTGCGEEGPTGVGSDLLGPGVRTFGVVVEAGEFLVADTAFDQIGTLDDAAFRLAAHEFEGDLEARTLLSILRPETVTYTPGEGQSAVTDTIAVLLGGRLTLVVDTLATEGAPVTVELLQVTEEWDRATAAWETRIGTAEETQAWSTPGGTTGPVLASAVWESGDTLRIPLDSAAVAVWDDSTAARIGGLVRTTSPGSRLFIAGAFFEFDVLPMEADTVLQAGGVLESKVILTPEMHDHEVGTLRVGGLPAWRSALRFRHLDSLPIPCGPGQPAGCTLRLGDVTINQASLLLSPLPAGPRRLERDLLVEGRAVLGAPGIPLVRSPLSGPLGPPSDTLRAAMFVTPEPDAPDVRLPVTGFVRTHVSPDTAAFRPDWLAITALGERGTFGYAVFGGVASDRPPRLRLIVSVPDEVGIR